MAASENKCIEGADQDTGGVGLPREWSVPMSGLRPCFARRRPDYGRHRADCYSRMS